MNYRERSRRVWEVRQRGAAISEDWLAVQAELRQLARDAQQEDVEATITATQGCQDHMELVREELVQRVHRRAVRAEVAEAQQWKQMFFKGISKNKVSGLMAVRNGGVWGATGCMDLIGVGVGFNARLG